MKYFNPAARDATIGECVQGPLLSGPKTVAELQAMYPWIHPKNIEGALKNMVAQGHIGCCIEGT